MKQQLETQEIFTEYFKKRLADTKDKYSELSWAAKDVIEQYKRANPGHVYCDCECDLCLAIKNLQRILKEEQ